MRYSSIGKVLGNLAFEESNVGCSPDYNIVLLHC